MVYIKDGKIVEGKPWSLRSIPEFFWGIIVFIMFFFKTLLGLDPSAGPSGRAPGGSKGNGPGDGPSGRGPRGPRTLGRVTTIQDCSMPGGGG